MNIKLKFIFCIIFFTLYLQGKTAFFFSSTMAKEPTSIATIAMMGDSITAGLGVLPNQSLPNKLAGIINATLQNDNKQVTILNRGVSGDTSFSGAQRISWLLSENPDGIILALGANDALRGIDPALTKNHLTNIIQTVQKRGIPIFLIGMEAPSNLGTEYAQAFRNIYKDLANQFNLPLYPFLLNGVALQPQYNQKDGIHPNPQGVLLIANQLAPPIISWLNKAF